MNKKKPAKKSLARPHRASPYASPSYLPNPFVSRDATYGYGLGSTETVEEVDADVADKTSSSSGDDAGGSSGSWDDSSSDSGSDSGSDSE